MKMFTKLAVVCVVGAALIAGLVDSVKAEEYEDEVVVEACVALADDKIQANPERRFEIVIELNEYKVVGNKYIINVNSTIVSEEGHVSHDPKFMTIVCELKGDTVYNKAIAYVDM